MTIPRRQIFAFSGMLRVEGDTRSNSDLTDHALRLCGKESGQRVCYVPTAVGDSPVAIESKTREFIARRPDVSFSTLTVFDKPNVPDMRAHLMSQDVVLVEGGSVANLLAVWRVHGLDAVLRDCWQAGVVLAGASAGSLCWHTGGPTDSFGDALQPFTNGLGLLPFSNGVHDDYRDQPRRAIYRKLVAEGTLISGYATEDGVGLHYIGTTLSEAVSIRESAGAWWVEADGHGGWSEQLIVARPL